MFSVNFKTRLQNLVRSLFLVTLQHPGQKLHFQSSKPSSSSSIVNFDQVNAYWDVNCKSTTQLKTDLLNII